MAAECCSVMSRRHLLNLRTLQQCHLPQRHGTQSVTSADLCSVAFVVLVFVFHQCHLAAENSREAPTLVRGTATSSLTLIPTAEGPLPSYTVPPRPTSTAFSELV
ncbi:hypothetical protein BD310DRAFT_933670 [Dichomitus squalens]|uniref:Uncharacterized protein n=1 Tax=Dichomitus squalens TaxID=114155 RepID=A0A4Q9PMI3_9APHY|nr:hypothetical protein BD310DRAFT_933670 [Dichomitus squalens]